MLLFFLHFVFFCFYFIFYFFSFYFFYFFFFFFQAEDGIRDTSVTGVQTCALPIFQPLVVLVITLTRVDVGWTPVKVALVPTAVLSGSVIFGSIWVITSSLAFWAVETQEVANSFTYGGVTLSGYPIDVFGTWLRRFVIFVVPV